MVYKDARYYSRRSKLGLGMLHFGLEGAFEEKLAVSLYLNSVELLFLPLKESRIQNES